MARVLQCVASRGVVSRVRRTTRSTCASVIVRGAPGRGSSSKPAEPLREEAPPPLAHGLLVDPRLPRDRGVGLAAAHASMMRARSARACAVVGVGPTAPGSSRLGGQRHRRFGRPRGMGVLLLYTENAVRCYLVASLQTLEPSPRIVRRIAVGGGVRAWEGPWNSFPAPVHRAPRADGAQPRPVRSGLPPRGSRAPTRPGPRPRRSPQLTRAGEG